MSFEEGHRGKRLEHPKYSSILYIFLFLIKKNHITPTNGKIIQQRLH